MITFENKELKKSVLEILEFFETNDIEYDFYDMEDVDDPDIEDSVVIDLHTRFNFGLPDCEEYRDYTIGETISLVQEVKSAKIVENCKYVSTNRAMIRVDLLNRERLSFIDDSIFEVNITFKGKDYSIDLIRDDIAFGILVVMSGEYNDYLPPMLYDELFIEISSKDKIDENIIDHIAHAYIFEINASLNIDLHESPRPELNDFYGDEEEDLNNSYKLRPLILNDGTKELLKLFNSASDLDSPEIQILYYSKAIEYVSQSVVKRELIETVLNKLYTPRTLQPTADYVLELEKIFDEQRSYRKDSESIRLTIETCCDIMELKSVSPIFLKKVKGITLNSKKDERIEALRELACALSDTRNMIAHAKTNYQKKGKECPEEQMFEFAKCCKLIAAQVIRWYARQHESAIVK